MNRDFAAEPAVAGSQICRFLILHKELDADDGELTRTRKVRRRIIAERYRPLVGALYSGRSTGRIETEISSRTAAKDACSSCDPATAASIPVVNVGARKTG